MEAILRTLCELYYASEATAAEQNQKPDVVRGETPARIIERPRRPDHPSRR
jgi:hypothetical protein